MASHTLTSRQSNYLAVVQQGIQAN
jgi:hypothetical protein